MKSFYKIAVIAVLLLSVSGCKVVDTINIEFPLGVKSLKLALKTLPDTSVSTEDTPVLVAYDITIDNEKLFGALKYYKDDEIVVKSVTQVSLEITKEIDNFSEEFQGLKLQAFVGEDEITPAYEGPTITDFDQTVTGDEDLDVFMRKVIEQAVAGKTVNLVCSGTFMGYYQPLTNDIVGDIILEQDITVDITVRR